MSEYIPLMERVEITRAEDADVPRVWYRVSFPRELQAGDWVVLVGRVNAIRSSGGYRTGAPPPGVKRKPPVAEEEVQAAIEFRFERNEIYLCHEAMPPKARRRK